MWFNRITDYTNSVLEQAVSKGRRPSSSSSSTQEKEEPISLSPPQTQFSTNSNAVNSNLFEKVYNYVSQSLDDVLLTESLGSGPPPPGACPTSLNAPNDNDNDSHSHSVSPLEELIAQESTSKRAPSSPPILNDNPQSLIATESAMKSHNSRQRLSSVCDEVQEQSTVTEISQQWSETTTQLNHRIHNLEFMEEHHKEWETAAADIRHWLERQDREWNRLESLHDNTIGSRARSDQLLESLTKTLKHGEDRWNTFHGKSQELISLFEKEDLNAVHEAVKEVGARWNHHYARIQHECHLRDHHRQQCMEDMKSANQQISLIQSHIRLLQTTQLRAEEDNLEQQTKALQSLLSSIDQERGRIEETLQRASLYYVSSIHESPSGGNILSNEVDEYTSQQEVNGVNSTDEIKPVSLQRLNILRNQLQMKWNIVTKEVNDYQVLLLSHTRAIQKIHKISNTAENVMNYTEKKLKKWKDVCLIEIGDLEMEFQHTEEAFQKCKEITSKLDAASRPIHYLRTNDVLISPELCNKLECLSSRHVQLENLLQERLCFLTERIKANHSQGYKTTVLTPIIFGDLMQSEEVANSCEVPRLTPSSESQSKKTLEFASSSFNNMPKSMASSSSAHTIVYSPLQEIMESLDEFKTIEYVAYRCAMKLRRIQFKMGMDFMKVEQITQISQTQRLRGSGGPPSCNLRLELIELFQKACEIRKPVSPPLPIPDRSTNGVKLCRIPRRHLSWLARKATASFESASTQLRRNSISCIPSVKNTWRRQWRMNSSSSNIEDSKIPDQHLLDKSGIAEEATYRRTLECQKPSVTIQLYSRGLTSSMCVDHIMSWLKSIFHITEEEKLDPRQSKVILSLLCGSSLNEKFQGLFDCIAEVDHQIRSTGLKSLLRCLECLMEQMGESSTSTDNPLIQKCLQKNENIEWEEFHTWISSESSLFAWLHALHRLISAEGVRHNVRCAVCHQTPIEGIRYHCLHCVKYDLCQSCFLKGKKSAPHKTSHLMQEYCSSMTSRQGIRDVSRMFINRFKLGDSLKLIQHQFTSGHGKAIEKSTQFVSGQLRFRSNEEAVATSHPKPLRYNSLDNVCSPASDGSRMISNISSSRLVDNSVDATLNKNANKSDSMKASGSEHQLIHQTVEHLSSLNNSKTLPERTPANMDNNLPYSYVSTTLFRCRPPRSNPNIPPAFVGSGIPIMSPNTCPTSSLTDTMISNHSFNLQNVSSSTLPRIRFASSANIPNEQHAVWNGSQKLYWQGLPTASLDLMAHLSKTDNSSFDYDTQMNHAMNTTSTRSTSVPTIRPFNYNPLSFHQLNTVNEGLDGSISFDGCSKALDSVSQVFSDQGIPTALESRMQRLEQRNVYMEMQLQHLQHRILLSQRSNIQQMPVETTDPNAKNIPFNS